MKNITIYARGSWDWETRKGRFLAALEYQEHYRYITGGLTNTTTDRCILMGLLQAVHLVNQPCKLRLVTAIQLSFNSLGNPKGRNKDLKQLLLNIIHKKQCSYEFDGWLGDGERLKARFAEIEKIAVKVAPIDIIAYYSADDFQQPGLF